MQGDSPPWPAAVFAVAILATITAITIAAIWKYDTTDEAFKFWSALSGLLGVITGAGATYFLTRSEVNTAKDAAAAARDQAARLTEVVQRLT
jgi:hypothetical protein